MAERSILTESSDEAALIYGAYDANITLIEQKLDVKIYNRSGEIVISGESAGTERAYKVNTIVDSEGQGKNKSIQFPIKQNYTSLQHTHFV